MPPISGLKFEWEGDTSPNTKTKSDEIQMWAMGGGRIPTWAFLKTQILVQLQLCDSLLATVLGPLSGVAET